MASLLKADSEQGYFMTDRSTYIVAQKEHPELSLKILFEGDPVLVNHYDALTVNPTLYPKANYGVAKQFVEFLGSEKGKKIVTEFGKKEYGGALYFVNGEP